jgi:uncharacterized protein (TIGR02569 family)
MNPPPDPVLDAFGTHGMPVALGGGRGTSWRVGDLVLKPVDVSVAELDWQASVLGSIRPQKVRLATPVRSKLGALVVDGWTASPFLDGRHERGRWVEIIEVGVRLSRALAALPRPDFLDRRTGPWATADRMAWGEVPIGALQRIDHIAQLAAMRRPTNAASQIIHGDLAGNVLFAKGVPPAVIDFSPFWRAPAYATAMVVGDAVVWEGAGANFLSALEGGPDRGQYFIRAVLFRAIVDALIRPSTESVRIARAYEAAIEIARDLEKVG